MASIQAVRVVPADKTLGLVLSGSSLKGGRVVNYKGEDLGKIEEIMIDLDRARVAYAVLSFGGFLGLGDKLFAIPWQAITGDTIKKQLILNVDKALLEKAPEACMRQAHLLQPRRPTSNCPVWESLG